MSFEFLPLLSLLLLLYIGYGAAKPKWTQAIEENDEASDHTSCELTTSNDWIIKFEEHPALFIINKNKRTVKDCRSLCCKHGTCNGYVFYHAEQTENCRLLKCSNGVDCRKALKLVKNDTGKVEVGFITGLGAHVNVTKAEPTQNHIEYNAEAAKLDNVASLQESQSKEDTVKPTVSQFINKKTTAVKSDPVVHILSSTHDDESVEKSQVSSPDNNMAVSKMDNYTAQQLTKYMDPFHNDIKEHTNSISLTIALVFGMAFLLTVFYLTGKRWVEGIKDRQRKGYTRINYLLNGV